MTEQERELQQRLEQQITCGNEACNCNYMGYCMENIDMEPPCSWNKIEYTSNQ